MSAECHSPATRISDDAVGGEPCFVWHPTGGQWFSEIVAAIERAQSVIDLEFYIWTPGRLANRLQGGLARAVARGCRVRLLLDAFGSTAAGPSAEILAQAGVEVRWFNPHRWSRLSFRNHRKLVVVDGQVAFLGGCNVADEYDGDGVHRGWRDLGICIANPACADALARSFEQMWAMACFNRLPTAQTMPLPAQGNGWELFFAGAGRGGRRYRRRLHRDLTLAKQIDVLAAYFVPTTHVRGILGRAARRGNVRVIIPAIGDVALAHHASAYVLDALASTEIRVYRYLPAMLHAKLVVADDVVYVGSANFDPRSLRINFDVMLRLENAAIATQARAIVDEIQAHSLPCPGRSPGLWSALRRNAAYAVVAWVDPYLARQKLRLLS